MARQSDLGQKEKISPAGLPNEGPQKTMPHSFDDLFMHLHPGASGLNLDNARHVPLAAHLLCVEEHGKLKFKSQVSY